ncbi:MAG: DUF488 domain-containing protein [Xenococcaceae cyanobacterium MO_207.B15]|nr:DUF488 domain-containing protein [Xenococcaceae cyanobacterium MO_207.B15]
MSRKLFTIGHSNHNIEKFIALLKEYQVTAIADVRSSPYSRYLSHFNQTELKFYLKEARISYVFLGKELGARPKDESCYADGKAIYEKIAARKLFTEGIERVIKGSKKYNIALMCAEKEPITCHRAVLLCQHLRNYDLEINHIHQDSSLESHEQLEDRLLDLNGYNKPKQLNLFEQSVAVLEKTHVSKEEALKEAYINQGFKIAYVEKST